MPNFCYKQAYMKGFDCESISLEKYVNIFEWMEIAESIYEGTLDFFIKTLPMQTPTVLVISGIREEICLITY